MQIAFAQMNSTVGAIQANKEKMMAYTQQAIEQQADLIVFPELALCGYPPEDLLYRQDFLDECKQALNDYCEHRFPITATFPLPYQQNSQLMNAVAIVQHGKIIAWCYKQDLPNYGVFDEKRYFSSGTQTCIIELNGKRIGFAICEDLWGNEIVKQFQSVDWLISINASPFEVNKYQERCRILQKHCNTLDCPILYVNSVGGQDELVFDGGSMLCQPHTAPVFLAPFFEETFGTLSTQANQTPPSDMEQVYQALILGVRDYVKKNGFERVLIGSSGGIDSAIVLCIAVAALGAENVTAVMMPSIYTSNLSLTEAEQLAKNLGIQHHTIPIHDAYESFLKTLAPYEIHGVTKENIQARCRGILLMALSNETGALVLNTSNRSEMAVGYGTLYGDMVGSFAVLKDLYKTKVYALAQYINRENEIIPEAIIHRPPSAELAENQKDEDSLPPYDVLDTILALYLDEECGISEIISREFDAKLVSRVVQLVQRNEYKRRQAPLGVKLHPKAFGRDRRYPITQRHQLVDKQ